MLKRNQLIILMIAILVGLISCDARVSTLQASPNEVDFNTVNLGEESTRNVLLINKYGEDISIRSIDISGSNDFMITNGISLPSRLRKDQYLLVTVRYKPTTAGTRFAYISITDTGSSNITRISLRGVGVAVARMLMSDDKHDFGPKLRFKPHTHDVDIENYGTYNLMISNLTLSGSDASAFKVTSAPLTIIPGEKKTVTITFEPTELRSYSTTLTIIHNAVNENTPIIYPILGEGIDLDPQITLSQSVPWDFGAVANILTSVQTCEIENTGIDPLTVTSATLTTNAEFKILNLTDSGGNVINFPQTLQVGAKIYLNIEFTPTAITPYNDTLTIVHDGTNQSSPWDINLNGSGKTPTVKTINYTGTVDNWQVPAGVTCIRIEAWGGQGGDNIALTNQGGKGARMRGDFPVTPGETLKFVVAQRGYNATSGNTANGAGGGGGGSFAWRPSEDTYPLIAAGGGGASCLTNNGLPHYQGKDGVTSEAATGSRSHDVYNNSPGGKDGNDGKTITDSGGKGWKSVKLDPSGGTGARYGGNGGYGGGGANGLLGINNYIHTGGGAGGYSGGGAGGTNYYYGGGGGGSYNAGYNQDNSAGIQTGNGKIEITY